MMLYTVLEGDATGVERGGKIGTDFIFRASFVVISYSSSVSLLLLPQCRLLSATRHKLFPASHPLPPTR